MEPHFLRKYVNDWHHEEERGWLGPSWGIRLIGDLWLVLGLSDVRARISGEERGDWCHHRGELAGDYRDLIPGHQPLTFSAGISALKIRRLGK